MNMMTPDLDAQAQETIDSLRRTIDPMLQKTKGNLFYQKGAGFLGSLLCKLSVQWTREFPTAAIGAKTLYWNPDFFLKLDKDTRVTVLAHELWHNAMMHGARLGSDEQILRFNSEVKFIQEELQPEKLTLVTFDTHVRDEYVFEKDDPFEKIVVTGRDGTSLRDVFEHAQRHAPTAMIVFSDLEVAIPENPGIQIIWVGIGSRSKKVPYGQLIYLEK